MTVKLIFFYSKIIRYLSVSKYVAHFVILSKIISYDLLSEIVKTK